MLKTTEDLRTGVASRWITLPSSISAPSTLVPMISAVSGSTTEKPKVPRNCGAHWLATGWVAFSSPEMPSRMTAGIANSKARLRLIVARKVIRMTTGLRIPDMTLASSFQDAIR